MESQKGEKERQIDRIKGIEEERKRKGGRERERKRERERERERERNGEDFILPN